MIAVCLLGYEGPQGVLLIFVPGLSLSICSSHLEHLVWEMSAYALCAEGEAMGLSF